MKLLHTADIHLGITNYGRIDPETGLNTRLLDFERSFRFMVERAIEEKIDAFLFAGDAYRTADPTPTQQKLFADCLRPLAEAGIPLVMIIGNHDHPVTFGKASALDIFGYLDGRVHLYRRPSLDVIPTRSGPLQLVALPWPVRSMILAKDAHRGKTPTELRQFIEARYIDYLEKSVRAIEQGEMRNGHRLDPTLPTVLMGHVTVQGSTLAGSERTSLLAHEPKFTVGHLARPPIDYVALGHIHHHQNRNESDGPPVVYSGSIERISFKEWDELKGFVLLNIATQSDKKNTTWTFVETPARRFVSVSLDARDTEDPTDKILAAIAARDVSDAIVRVRYHIDENQVPEVDVRRLREALQGAHAVASIERTVDPIERRQRTIVTRDSTLEDALRRYVAQHEHLAPLEENLVEAGLELDAEDAAARREA